MATFNPPSTKFFKIILENWVEGNFQVLKLKNVKHRMFDKNQLVPFLSGTGAW
ncbi:MAG: hypothetical protein HYW89_04850 [Candidatus Sungiibacteriota bacterium]|uniref:Uncharacterized protein n=1 Tax=Candidatus Sungiibacteriota bacterium TaxID=2750080 RepID=A0A7T5UQN2_9BACT|nr:MAG: hypothetical protein HYW89_04850 [Candidatus Sungbacteria bacterium]